MNLGELLRDALDESSDYGRQLGVDILACFDFQAAAEAFLAKVKEAEQAEAVGQGDSLIPPFTMDS